MDYDSFVVTCKCFKLMASSSTEEVCIKQYKSLVFHTRSQVPILVLHAKVSVSRKKSGDRGFSDLPLSSWYKMCYCYRWLISLLYINVETFQFIIT